MKYILGASETSLTPRRAAVGQASLVGATHEKKSRSTNLCWSVGLTFLPGRRDSIVVLQERAKREPRVAHASLRHDTAAS